MTMTVSCAGTRPPSVPAPVRLTLPDEARRPCRLVTLGPAPTLGDLEAAYMARGAALVACDAARRLAVATLMAERLAGDAAAEANRQKLP
ncbi:hypothetical protein [Brevundimonas sp.]|uniref:hypothetical protein n=1 Tax=Brevundimonas sp. TaxID=1871086 RepID=UPI003AF44769